MGFCTMSSRIHHVLYEEWSEQLKLLSFANGAYLTRTDVFRRRRWTLHDTIYDTGPYASALTTHRGSTLYLSPSFRPIDSASSCVNRAEPSLSSTISTFFHPAKCR